MTDTTQTPAPAAARVTIDDVRAAIMGADPNSTNASKVRAMLGGRGSFETIQKHLGTLRQELAAAAMPPVATDQVPALPPEAAQAMWVAAWTAAQVKTLARTEQLATERDAALLRLETMGGDLADQVQTLDEQSTQLDQAAAAVATVQAAHLETIEAVRAAQAAAAADHAELAHELEAVKAAAATATKEAAAELAQEKAQAQHAAELAESGRELMRQELARLTDQIGELKAHLYKRAGGAGDAGE